MKVRRFFLRLLPRLGIFVLSVLLLSVLTFYISRLAPGDPLVSYYGYRVEKMSPAEREWAEDKLGLNDPLPTQYARWFSRALHGDFGISYKYKMDVLEVIRTRLPYTLRLGGVGFVLLFVLSLGVGVLCARRENSLLDRILCRVGTVMSCVPEFWLSLVLILLFAVELRWLPSSGAYSVGGDGGFADRAVHLILPVTVVVLGHLWYYACLGPSRLFRKHPCCRNWMRQMDWQLPFAIISRRIIRYRKRNILDGRTLLRRIRAKFIDTKKDACNYRHPPSHRHTSLCILNTHRSIRYLAPSSLWPLS